MCKCNILSFSIFCVQPFHFAISKILVASRQISWLFREFDDWLASFVSRGHPDLMRDPSRARIFQTQRNGRYMRGDIVYIYIVHFDISYHKRLPGKSSSIKCRKNSGSIENVSCLKRKGKSTHSWTEINILHVKFRVQ